MFSLRTVQGYRYLDRCGDLVIRLEDALDIDWIPGEISPTGADLRNYTLGMTARLNANSITIAQREFMHFEKFAEQACIILQLALDTFEIVEIMTPGFRVDYQMPVPNRGAAEELLFGLKLATIDNGLLGAMGGHEENLNLVVVTCDERDWDGEKVRHRGRVHARAIHTEKQPAYDERLSSREELLSMKHKAAIRNLQELRKKTPALSSDSLQIDVESAFETEFKARTFDFERFMIEGNKWCKGIHSFVEGRRK